MFSTKTMEFLIENRMRNNKQWYKEQKDVYTELVLHPLMDFVTEISPTMLSIDPLIVTDPRVDKTISRIYRDTRFSKDKTAFRDNMWCTFMRDKKIFHNLPAYFFEITSEGFIYGCGYYGASTEFMARMREMIVSGNKGFKAARSAFNSQDSFIMEGDLYKRSKFPNENTELKNWLDRRNICLTCHIDDNQLLFSDRLVDHIAKDFLKIKPFYDFFINVENSK